MLNSKLLPLVKKANQVSSDIIPVLECLLINEGELIASNLSTSLIQKVPFEGSFLVPAKQLQKILMKLPKTANVVLHGQEKKSCVQVDGKDKFFFNDLDFTQEFPKPPGGESIGKGNLTQTDVDRIHQAAKYCSTDELRPAMTGIFLDGNIAASDGHMLYWTAMSGSVPENFILKKEVLKILKGSYQLESFGAHVVLDNGEDKIYTRVIDERYPDYKNVIPEETTTRAVIVDDLLNLVEQALIQANPVTKQVILDFNEKGLEVESHDIDFGHAFKDSFETKITGEPLRIAFNGGYLSKILKDVKDPSISLGQANQAAIFSGDQISILLMPIMITELATK